MPFNTIISHVTPFIITGYMLLNRLSVINTGHAVQHNYISCYTVQGPWVVYNYLNMYLQLLCLTHAILTFHPPYFDLSIYDWLQIIDICYVAQVIYDSC